MNPCGGKGRGDDISPLVYRTFIEFYEPPFPIAVFADAHIDTAANMRFTLITATAAVSTALARDLDIPKQTPSATPVLGSTTSHGCFSAKAGDAADVRSSMLSSGTCFRACRDSDERYAVAILGPSECLCANEYPPEDSLVKDERCSYSCPGYPLEACGGLGNEHVYSVFNLGIEVNVPYAEAGASEGDDGDEEDGPSDSDSEGDKGDKGADEDGGEDVDEHHSPTPLWTASETPSGTATATATVTSSTSLTAHTDDDSQATTEGTASATASPSPVESDPPNGATVGRHLSMGAVAGGAFVAAILAGQL